MYGKGSNGVHALGPLAGTALVYANHAQWCILNAPVINPTGKQHMKMGYTTSNKIIKYERYYADNLTIIGVEHYEKCGYRCFYCITDSQGKTRPTVPDLATLQSTFREELKLYPTDNYFFGVSLATDSYNDIEEEYGYTRWIIDELSALNRKFSITTRGPLVVRDIDLFKRMAPDRYKIIISLACSTYELAKRVEPQAPSPESRLEALHRLHAEGVNVCVQLVWIPELTDTETLLNLFPKGIKVFFQPLELGHVFEETLDNKRPHFSAAMSLGKQWSQDEINRAYIRECNSVGIKYWKQFDMEWRFPITSETHTDNTGYLKRMRPGRYDPDQWVAEHPVACAERIASTSE